MPSENHRAVFHDYPAAVRASLRVRFLPGIVFGLQHAARHRGGGCAVPGARYAAAAAARTAAGAGCARAADRGCACARAAAAASALSAGGNAALRIAGGRALSAGVRTAARAAIARAASGAAGWRRARATAGDQVRKRNDTKEQCASSHHRAVLWTEKRRPTTSFFDPITLLWGRGLACATSGTGSGSDRTRVVSLRVKANHGRRARATRSGEPLAARWGYQSALPAPSRGN